VSGCRPEVRHPETESEIDMLIGHLAVSILTHRYAGTDLAPTLIGALFPDAVDKTLCQVLRVTPNGRMWAHTILALGGSTVLVRLLAGRETAYAWALGYAGHFFADSPGTLPLAYPFRAYTFSRSPGFGEILRRFLENREAVALEIALLILSLLLVGPLDSKKASRRAR
jgi:hypothetical protein